MIDNWFIEIYNEFIKSSIRYDNWFYSLPLGKRPKEKLIAFSLSPSTSLLSHYNFTSPKINIHCISRIEKLKESRGSALEVIHYYGGIPRVSIPIMRESADILPFIHDCNIIFKEWIERLPGDIYTSLHPKLTFYDGEDSKNDKYDLFYSPEPNIGRDISWSKGYLKIPLFPYNLHIYKLKEDWKINDKPKI